jgi:hypothetical protein
VVCGKPYLPPRCGKQGHKIPNPVTLCHRITPDVNPRSIANPLRECRCRPPHRLTPPRRHAGDACAVHYAFVYALNCHCSKCRSATGPAFKPFAGIERQKPSLTQGNENLLTFGDAQAQPRCSLRPMWLTAFSGRTRRRLGSRNAGHAPRYRRDPPGCSHFRRLKGALVRNHGHLPQYDAFP